jgi:hypothetical protein
VTPATHQRERAHAEFLSHFQRVSLSNTSSGTTSSTIADTTSSSTATKSTHSRGAELYTLIHAASADFQAYIDSSHEAVQLLYQAYMCSFKYVLLLVGDRSGNIIRGKNDETITSSCTSIFVSQK